MNRTPYLALLLAFTLLFNQVAGFAHGITHTLAEQTQDHSLPGDRLCELCASYAQLGTALGSVPLSFDAVEHPVDIFHPASATSLTAASAAFSARAPPCFA